MKNFPLSDKYWCDGVRPYPLTFAFLPGQWLIWRVAARSFHLVFVSFSRQL